MIPGFRVGVAVGRRFPCLSRADAPPTLDPVVVTGSRVEHSSFDLPVSVDVVDAARIGADNARVNASEALAAVPGITVLNRQNYAQDLQISSRGFGARSAFGVRGIRLVSDGIPASMPDGQGQAATFNLDRAERIEVMRGPMSAIYGNSAGGVIQLFTVDGEDPPSVETRVAAGSYGTWKADVAAQGRAGEIGLRARRVALRDRRLSRSQQRRRPRPEPGQADLCARCRQQGHAHRQRLRATGPGSAGHDLDSGIRLIRAASRRRPCSTTRARASINCRAASATNGASARIFSSSWPMPASVR